MIKSAILKRYWPHIAGGIAVIVSLYQVHNYIYQSGYTAAVTHIQAEHNKALELQRKEYERRTQEALVTIAADHDASIRRLKQEREVEYVTKEVIRYVTEEINVPSECDDLAVDIVGLLDQAASIVIITARSTESSNSK